MTFENYKTMLDIWRTINPYTKRYTWRQNKPLIQCRLDYFFISNNLTQNVKSCDIKPSIRTDHSLLTLKITLNKNEPRGPGFWKFNTSLLKDIEYIDLIKNKLNLLKENLIDMNDKALKWDYIKSEIRQQTIIYAKAQARNRKRYENDLKTKYYKASTELATNKNQENLKSVEDLKAEIELINKYKTDGAQLRCKATEIQKKTNSSYFKAQEKKNYQTCHITCIEDTNKNEITQPKHILEQIKLFYKTLYSEENFNDNNDSIFLNNTNIPKLNDNLKRECEKEITIDECAKSLKNMKNGKTPGSDGLSVEFYKLFWNSIKDLVFESFLYSYDLGELSIDQKRGIIKLLPKKDKILKFLKNWRPISLLNTDYKIIAHVLAARLQIILPYIIHPDQNGYIKGRYIGCNIRTIYDVIELSQNLENANIITFIDYEKAFDSLKLSFLFKTLKTFGFGDYFINWVKVLYKNISSCVVNNGYSSEFFHLSKGVRQGCPLSALLFILVVEILAIKIRNDKNIKGVKFNQHEIKVSLFADDTTIFVKDPDSLQTVLNTMGQFKTSSGLSINYSKTNVIQVGEKTWNLKKLKISDVEEIYSLGTWFYKDHMKINNQNYEIKYKQFENILSYWENRKLNILERIKIVKTYAFSKINYIMSNLQITEDFVLKVQKSINDFIWNKKKPKIKQQVAYQSIKNGGLAIPDIEKIVMSNRITWIKRLLGKENRNLQFISMYLPKLPFEYFIKCNYNPTDLPLDIPLFYHQILFAWFSLKNEPHDPIQIRNELVLINKYIEIDKMYFFDQKLLNSNTVLVNDFFEKSGKPMSYQAFTTIYGNIISSFRYMSLIDAIPSKWKKNLTKQVINRDICSIHTTPTYYTKKEKPIDKITSKEIYLNLVHRKTELPTCINSWNNRLNLEYNAMEWEPIFILPFRCTLDSNLRINQLKILHRFYPCQSLVSKWDSEVNEICNLCNLEKDTIYHMFCNCNQIKSFWNEIVFWLRMDKFPELSETQILFGILPYTASNHGINHCILHCKYFIHLEKINKTFPNLQHFLRYYKNIMKLEEEFYTIQNEKSLFNKIFGIIKTKLQ